MNSSPGRRPQLLSVEKVAKALDVSQKTVLRGIRSGELRAHKFGRQWRVSDEDLRTYVAARRM